MSISLPALPNPTSTGQVHFAGDSITIADVADGRFCWFVGSAEAIRLSFGGPPGGRDRGARGYTHAGIDGIGIVTFQANLSTLVFAFRPEAVVVYIGTNDITGATDPTTFINTYRSVVDSLKTGSNYPGGRAPQVALMTPLCVGEKFPSGANAFDLGATGVEAVCASIRTVASEKSCTLIDLRTQWLNTWAAVKNPGNLDFIPGGVGTTVDGRHWTVTGATDKDIGAYVAAQFSCG